MPSPLDSYDWDWYARFGDEVGDELVQVFQLIILYEYPAMVPNRLQELAREFASTRGGRLLRLDGDENLMQLTRTRVSQVVADAIKEGAGLEELQQRLEADPGFSPERATRVARTETAIALGQGGEDAAREQGRNEKSWMTQGDGLESAECSANEADGWIPIEDAFSSTTPAGAQVFRVPQHPNCRCSNLYRTAEVPGTARLREFRCQECGGLLAERAVLGAEYFCRRCKIQRQAPLSSI